MKIEWNIFAFAQPQLTTEYTMNLNELFTKYMCWLSRNSNSFPTVYLHVSKWPLTTLKL